MIDQQITIVCTWQYGTEISKTSLPIYVIYEYGYEYSYEYKYVYIYVDLCGEIGWLIPTKLFAYPIIYVLVLQIKTTMVDHVLEARRCHQVALEDVGIWSRIGTSI